MLFYFVEHISHKGKFFFFLNFILNHWILPAQIYFTFKNPLWQREQQRPPPSWSSRVQSAAFWQNTGAIRSTSTDSKTVFSHEHLNSEHQTNILSVINTLLLVLSLYLYSNVLLLFCMFFMFIFVGQTCAMTLKTILFYSILIMSVTSGQNPGNEI